jgi:alkanesulfonate monooxygenase SsuD/methylene tetrahydromethanopterin reductase-like flavin-dependent oxidoreductase (luciferase family)
MLKLTGRYGDIVYLPPWLQGKVTETVEAVRAAADEASRAAPRLMLGMMDSRAYSAAEYARVSGTAAEAGAEYYTVAFPGMIPMR